MIFPKDPVMLLSVVNTYLRDHHSSLDDLCKSNDIKRRINKTARRHLLLLRRRTKSICSGIRPVRRPIVFLLQ